MNKYFFTYNDVHNTLRDAANTIKSENYQPDYLLAIGGGGFIPARMLRSFINRPILSVALTRYIDETGSAPSDQPMRLQWLDNLTDIKGKKVLVIDEVDDERTTLEYTLNALIEDYPETEFSALVVHNKRKPKKGQLPAQLAHFFVGKEIEDYWINYAWDADDIDSFGV